MIPVIVIYLWMKKKLLTDETHRNLQKKALLNGFKSIGPILIIGTGIYLIMRLVLRMHEDDSVLAAFIYNFFVLALSEEISKGYMMQRLVKKNEVGYTWLDIMVFTVIVATGFDILESAVFAAATSPMQVIVRGITMPHLAFGFIMGYFAGKAIKENNKLLYIPALIVPWIIHGAYDFCLSPVVLATADIFGYTALALAAFDLVMVIIMIIFFVKASKQEKYTTIIRPAKEIEEGNE